ncbi:Flp pilus assembly protein TadB [Cryptosporangium arvum DSM 44712]|uniref:Flp pilus assembly protein TadB n=1 Tax=Cryptosporangium arvum DSM 44712 TaxID=927661 RepID=A0A011ABC1_9ACTN|nr:Flp pilus assembly protein TadB [Cryptosporangium arvum DSM 44712]
MSVAAGSMLLIVAFLVARPTARRRLKRSTRVGAADGSAGEGVVGSGVHPGASGGPAGSGGSVALRWVVPCSVGLAVAGLVGTWWGLIVGAAVGVGVHRLVRRMPSPAINREREAAAAELPYAVDLLAAVLKSGAPLDRAVAVVGAAIGGPLGERLALVGRALRLGVVGEPGWRALDDVPGAEGFVPAAVRAADSGAALAAACTRCAADLREGREARAEAAAHRAAVWVVLPLGFCFLPAFVLVGVVPIVLGVLDELLT